MHRALTLAAACVTAAAMLLVPAIAVGNDWDRWFDDYEVEYLRAYETAYEADLDVGRNIVDDGLANGERPSRERVEASTATLRRWLAPPEPEPAAPPGSSPTYYSGSSSWDAVAACESGGDWSISTGNGYYGGLQFDSQTWDAYGDPSCSEASDCSREAQIAAAESMPYDGWPNC